MPTMIVIGKRTTPWRSSPTAVAVVRFLRDAYGFETKIPVKSSLAKAISDNAGITRFRAAKIIATIALVAKRELRDVGKFCIPKVITLSKKRYQPVLVVNGKRVQRKKAVPRGVKARLSKTLMKQIRPYFVD